MLSPLTFVSALALSAAIASPITWLQGYIQLDTRNPPGNENIGAEYLAALLEQHSIPVRLLTSPEGRTSLYARLPATRLPADGSPAPDLILLHHIDVVDTPGDWTSPPFSAHTKDGRIWGRGALDAKGLGIAHLAAMIRAKLELEERAFDLVFLASADEERGGKHGVGWLLEAHPELFSEVTAVLNEGGSNRGSNDRLLWWGIEVTQKRPLWMSVHAFGRGGHASGLNPLSALHQLIRGLDRVLEAPLQFRVSPAARMYFAEIDKVSGDDFHTRLDAIFATEDPSASLPIGVPTFFLDTIQVTSIDTAGGDGNIISPRASAYLDARLLPDTDLDQFVDQLRSKLGNHLDLEIHLSSPKSEISPRDHPVYQALERALEVRARVIPTFIAGTTDSRYFRERGIPAYGFSPFALNPRESRGIHAANESIPTDAFLRGIEMMYRVIEACLTPNQSFADN